MMQAIQQEIKSNRVLHRCQDTGRMEGRFTVFVAQNLQQSLDRQFFDFGNSPQNILGCAGTTKTFQTQKRHYFFRWHKGSQVQECSLCFMGAYIILAAKFFEQKRDRRELSEMLEDLPDSILMTRVRIAFERGQHI